jgi:Sigma 54 modulation protein / S30EA ribosomal protein
MLGHCEDPLNIQINSDKNITIDTQIRSAIEEEVNRTLEIFAGRLTRVEIHLSDVNSDKPGEIDKRCLLEVRPARRRPLAVTSSAGTVEAAVRGALGKIRSALTRTFGKEGKPRARGQRAEGVPVSSRPRKRKFPGRKVTAAKKKATKTADTKELTTKKTARKTTVTKSASKNVALSPRGPKKKGTYRARRKAWPKR